MATKLDDKTALSAAVVMLAMVLCMFVSMTLCVAAFCGRRLWSFFWRRELEQQEFYHLKQTNERIHKLHNKFDRVLKSLALVQEQLACMPPSQGQRYCEAQMRFAQK